jgi:hypothetical protein
LAAPPQPQQLPLPPKPQKHKLIAPQYKGSSGNRAAFCFAFWLCFLESLHPDFAVNFSVLTILSSTPPTPAVVTQSAVRRLPRVALWLFCLAYVLPGFLGRDPWRNADLASFGFMRELALGQSSWWSISMLGREPDLPALLPYWLGAWAIQLAPGWVSMDFAVRVPFALLLGVTLAATWYAVYYLARREEAQPVPFAFGGEAQPTDYARAMADGGLLAMIAMLGLAQLSHETTPNAAQLAFTALLFFAYAASPYRTLTAAVTAALASLGLALSGVPAFGLALACAGALVRAVQPDMHARRWAVYFAVSGIAAAGLAIQLGLWHARMGQLPANWADWRSWGKLMLWFTWPAWPMALVALWKWRAWWHHFHMALPLALALVIVVATLIAPSADRTLLLVTPTLACLAAFALPTLQRSITALIDWFTLLFFCGCGLIIWVVWVAMQTGVPAQPAANVRRLVPGFEPSFSWWPFLAALAATLAWIWLVTWRAGRHRDALWKSLVLPAGGAAMSWVLLMSLWMPLLNYVRSDIAVVRQVARSTGTSPDQCVAVFGVTQAEAAALSYHGKLRLVPLPQANACNWLVVHAEAAASFTTSVLADQWQAHGGARRRTSVSDDLLIFRRSTGDTSSMPVTR